MKFPIPTLPVMDSDSRSGYLISIGSYLGITMLITMNIDTLSSNLSAVVDIYSSVKLSRF